MFLQKFGLILFIIGILIQLYGIYIKYSNNISIENEYSIIVGAISLMIIGIGIHYFAQQYT